MSTPSTIGSKRPRGKYSRLICLGCRDRRIRCELPSDVEIPNSREPQIVKTPCYRCKKLGIQCIVRPTILGRPNQKAAADTADLVPTRTSDIVPRIIVDLCPHTAAQIDPATLQDEEQWTDDSAVSRFDAYTSEHVLPRHRDHEFRNARSLVIHNPQSAETVVIIHALDTLRYEHVEEEWFRHLPTHVGYSPGLDLSVKAIVAAAAYARGVPRLSADDCHQALVLALNGVQSSIIQSHGDPNDEILASTALLAPFEGTVRKNGIPTPLHLEGMAAILAARPAAYPITVLARDILDYFLCESTIRACIQGVPSSFERVPQAYFTNNRIGCKDSDRAELKALSNELFIRIPRLVGLARQLRLQTSPENQLLLEAISLSKSLLKLQDSEVEERLLQSIKLSPSDNPDTTSLHLHSLGFTSLKDFEALVSYWYTRLSLLRLDWRLYELYRSSDPKPDDSEFCHSPTFIPKTKEALRLVKNILMSLDYAKTLRLFRHVRLFAHALIAVWGAIKDAPNAVSYGRSEGEIASWLDTLLRRINNSLKPVPAFIAEDMDIAAEIFTGGQPEGNFADIYGLT